jgi:hypothetical protein
MKTSDDATLSTICAAALGVVFTIVALVTYDARTAGGVAVGSSIAVANLLVMRAIIRSLLQEPVQDREKDAAESDHRGAGRRGGTAWGVFALLKIFILFGGIWILLTKKLVDPIPLVVGYGVLPLGIAASALVRSLKPRR